MKRGPTKRKTPKSVEKSIDDRVLIHVLKPNFEEEVTSLNGKSDLESINAACGPLIVSTFDPCEAAKERSFGGRFSIHGKVDSYEKTGNAVYLLEAFLLSHEWGVFPPSAVLIWLYKSFDQFHKENGVDVNGAPINLSRMLGLAPGRGQEKSFQSLLRDELYEQLLISMANLKIHFGLSAIDAASLVEARLCATVGWNKSKFEIKAPYAAELIKKYSKVRAMYEQLITEYQVAPMSNEDRCQLINQYPKSAILELPPKARQKLKNYLK